MLPLLYMLFSFQMVSQSRLFHTALVCSVLLSITTACTSMVPRQYLPYPLTNETFGDPVKVVNVPLPVIKTDPNEDISLGALSAFLLHNQNDEISTMIVPQVNYNKNFGTTTTLYGAFYPSPDRSWEINLSQATKINEDYTLELRDNTFLDKKLVLNASLFLFTDGSARFFGFQSDSSAANETNYADAESGFTLSIGYKITEYIQVIVGERFRQVEIDPGAIDTLPFIQDKFTPDEVPGIEGFTTHAQQIALLYSSLDHRNMPTQGLYGLLAFENSAKFLGSSANYRHYIVEVKGYFPLWQARFITAARVAYNQTLNSEVPFLERSILGGKNTLRGHGENRFVDSSYLLFNLEERIRLFRYELFNVNTDWELAPFIDLGAVMENLFDVSARNFVVNPGIGFRAVVRPNVVGRVDIGFGNEGPAIFATLGYPF
jgi:hypothetical protein